MEASLEVNFGPLFRSKKWRRTLSVPPGLPFFPETNLARR